jgi:uncharacterized RDD family membrane protein YckC
MKQIRIAFVTLLIAGFSALLIAGLIAFLLSAALSVSLSAQARQVAPPPESPAERSPDPTAEVQLDPDAWRREVVRIGQDYTLKAGDAIGNAVVISGNATIDGHVGRDVVVVFGKAQLSSTAVIDGALIVVGGSAGVVSGATIRQDLVVVAGTLDAPAEFMPGGQHVVIGPGTLGGRLEPVVSWITRGLLWGRLIVPDLPWVWGFVGFFFLLYLALNLLFHESIRGCAETLTEKPLTTFAVGLLVLLLTGPVCFLLAVSVIGIAVVPFVLCSVFVAWIIGRVSVARWIGMSLMRQGQPDDRLQSIRSFAFGFALICLAYMVPVLGLASWAMVGVFGLGAAALTFIRAYRRENPAPAHPRFEPRPLPDASASSVRVPPPTLEGQMATPNTGSAAEFSPPASSTLAPVLADLASFPHAAFRDRLAAFVLDVILVVIAQQLLDLTRRDSSFFLLLLGYHIGFWTWKGTTVGGIICQLRIVRVDGAPLRFVDALVRGLSSIFSLAVVGLGCLWILKDPERQAWHDKIAGTYVVKVPRNWPL